MLVADQAKPQPGGDELLLMRQVSPLASRAIVVYADAGGHDLVERGVVPKVQSPPAR